MSQIIYEIYCKSTSGKTIKLNVNEQMTIEKLRELIEERENINNFQLLFAGRNLDRELYSTLSDFNIKEHVTIHCVPNMRGD